MYSLEGESSLSLNSALQYLIGQSLVSVEFVEDYLQLIFDSAGIDVYNPLSIKSRGQDFTLKNNNYRAELCSQIGKLVVATEINNNVAICLENNVTLEISLALSDYTCPEALLLKMNGRFWVA